MPIGAFKEFYRQKARTRGLKKKIGRQQTATRIMRRGGPRNVMEGRLVRRAQSAARKRGSAFR